MNRSQITVALCREHLQSIREIQEEGAQAFSDWCSTNGKRYCPRIGR
ncbi:hypothetical protein MO408_07195 [Klebsiella pneumoniae]|nr:hypothetical protein MO408_07195 [Klebsiella pneumoniae]